MQTVPILSQQKSKTLNCWLPTKACKYNISVLGTYFECEGVKCTYFDFTWSPWKRL